MKPINDAVARAFRMEPRELLLPTNERYIVRPRQVAMFLMRRAGYSLPQIGWFFAKNHATVLYGVRRIERECRESKIVRKFVNAIRPRGEACGTALEQRIEALGARRRVFA